LNNRKAVILAEGTKYIICCEVGFLPKFMAYVLEDPSHGKEIKLIFAQIIEGLKSKKYGDEPYNTKAMKPFKNRENDRILCNVTKRKGKKQCIVMSELYIHKTSQNNGNRLNKRYKIISNYNYDIIE